jgi:cytochrome c oxidase assembly factor CtaG
MNMVVSHWSANVAALAAYAVVAAGHLIGMRGAATEGRRSEAVVFQLGLLLALLAVVSPVGYWAGRFIWIRGMQDVVLAIGAPALIVLGAPWLPLRRALRVRRAGQDWAAVQEEQARAARSAGRGLLKGRRALPVLVTVAFSVVWWGWHLPVAFDAVLGHRLVYAAEVVMYLGAGVLLWLQVIGSRPYRPRLGPLHRVALVVGTAVSCTVLGLVLVFGNGVAYSAYSGAGHNVMSVVADQQVGGAVLWMVALVPFGAAVVALLIRWLNDEESQTLAAGIDRLLKPPKQTWPSRPGLR